VQGGERGGKKSQSQGRNEKRKADKTPVEWALISTLMQLKGENTGVNNKAKNRKRGVISAASTKGQDKRQPLADELQLQGEIGRDSLA